MKQLIQPFVFAVFLCLPFRGYTQQEVDNKFVPNIATPLFEKDGGPVILVDGGHYNFHTLEDKFAPFGKVAELNGFRLQSSLGRLKAEQLKNVKILVITNALNEKNVASWKQPVLPAFTSEEVKTITDWVRNGGRLFLIADHMPFAGAVSNLAQSLGFSFYDGFAMCKPRKKFDVFCFADGTLNRNTLTNLHGPIDSIVTFTGQAFKIPDGATSVISFDSSYKILLPEVAWEFNEHTNIIPAEGLSQLAYNMYGKGKVVVSGEAAMFTAQKVGDIKIGLSAPYAPNNVQLLSNILEWLAE